MYVRKTTSSVQNGCLPRPAALFSVDETAIELVVRGMAENAALSVEWLMSVIFSFAFFALVENVSRDMDKRSKGGFENAT